MATPARVRARSASRIMFLDLDVDDFADGDPSRDDHPDPEDDARYAERAFQKRREVSGPSDQEHGRQSDGDSRDDRAAEPALGREPAHQALELRAFTDRLRDALEDFGGAAARLAL